MALVGYARTSTADQVNSLQNQIERLEAAGCDRDLIFKEQRSGANRKRPKLEECLRTVRKGDILVVTKLDRLARSTVDLHNILQELERKGVGFKALDQSAANMDSSTGKLLLGILSVVAAFERDLIHERQSEGIRRAREKGTKFGRDPKATPEVVEQIKAQRHSGRMIKDIMASTGLSKATVYRALKQVA